MNAQTLCNHHVHDTLCFRVFGEVLPLAASLRSSRSGTNAHKTLDLVVVADLQMDPALFALR
eukprot:390715-Alexandrium_andersonii.AAC.1